MHGQSTMKGPLSCITLSLLALASLSLAAASDSSTAAEQALLQWIKNSGGEVNVAIAALPQGGRGVVATRDFTQGDVLARIPVTTFYTLSGPQDTWAAKLWQDMQDPDSPLGPFFRSLPSRDEVWSLYDIPDSYLPLIQSPQHVVEDRIQWLQHNFLPQPDAGSYDDGGPAFEGARYAMSLIETRQFAHHSDSNMGELKALLDMANHAQPCNTEQFTVNCDWTPHTTLSPNASPKMCTFWRATSDVATGTELCNSYRYLTSDMALLQYGFMISGPAARQLARFDRHDFNPLDVWGEPWQAAGSEEPTPFIARNAREAAEELSRLAQLHEQLTVRDAELAASPVQPHPRDTNGRFLGMALTWRAQRKQAVRLEMERLLKVSASYDEKEQPTGGVAES